MIFEFLGTFLIRSIECFVQSCFSFGENIQSLQNKVQGYSTSFIRVKIDVVILNEIRTYFYTHVFFPVLYDEVKRNIISALVDHRDAINFKCSMEQKCNRRIERGIPPK